MGALDAKMLSRLPRAGYLAGDGAALPHPQNRPIPVDNSLNPGELLFGYEDAEDAEEAKLERALWVAPAWLFSVSLHLGILVLLAVWAIGAHLKPDVQVEVVPSKFDESSLLDESEFQGTNPLKDMQGTDAETLITDQSLPPVEDPFAAPAFSDIPNPSGVLAAPGTGPGTSNIMTSDIKGAPIGLALKGRQIGSKPILLGAYGGNKVTEAAVLRGLEWLARHQKADGSWSLMGPYGDGGRVENVPSATAMALIAFQGHGDTPTEGKFKENVTRGWNFLLKQQDADGFFASAAQGSHLLYTQAQCSIAICELYGMTNDAKYREPAERSIRYAVSAQDKTLGGWRYIPRDGSDVSVTGWFVMALQSAKMAKLEVPQESLDLVMKFLDKSQYNDGRAYYYSLSHGATPAVAAEGLLCRQYLGWKQDDIRLVEGCAALTKQPISYRGDSNIQDVYYWYYATQACHHMENPLVNGQKVPIWDAWNEVMREQVPAHQVRGNKEDGSWSPIGDKWGLEGGRLYTTCLSIYMLEVYYRHLPIYSGYKFFAAEANAPPVVAP